MRTKQIQIPEKLFAEILAYFSGNEDPELKKRIQNGIEEKLDAMIRRDYDTASKTAQTPQEREEARQRYLDAAGIPNAFRWEIKH